MWLGSALEPPPAAAVVDSVLWANAALVHVGPVVVRLRAPVGVPALAAPFDVLRRSLSFSTKMRDPFWTLLDFECIHVDSLRKTAKMTFERSWLSVILVAAVSLGVVATCIDSWHAATHSDLSGIERIIDVDREYFRSMQSVWDKYEEEHPGWMRPEPTSVSNINSGAKGVGWQTVDEVPPSRRDDDQ